ncbi:hypothetical protein BGZ76_011283 [Entomortierella beljakovae]|nr:hypothetical protein BGZ76_011283 [Entomortierella beljakovae]
MTTNDNSHASLGDEGDVTQQQQTSSLNSAAPSLDQSSLPATTSTASEPSSVASTTTLRASIGAGSELPAASFSAIASEAEILPVISRQDLLSSIRANAGNPPSNVAISTAATLEQSDSDHAHTSLSVTFPTRRYPSIPLRSTNLRTTQHHIRHPHLPLPEREDSSRPRAITFGTLKKASMSNHPPSSTSEKKSKMVALPAYLRYTTFKQHFQPEGGIGEFGVADREPSKRRRLLGDATRRRHTHLYHDSDSSNSSSGGESSENSSSGGESGNSSYENDTSVPLRLERRPLRYQIPSRWNLNAKTDKTDLSEDDLQVHYTGPGKSDGDASSILANRHIPPQCGVYYYEVLIKSKGQQGYIGIGVCNATVALDRLPGWEPQSWGYHGDDGNSFEGCGNGRPFGPVFTTGDVIGCGVNFRDMSLFYTKNGVHLGVAFRNLKGTLYPTIGMRTVGEIIEANFGQRDFVFNIEDYVRNEKVEAWQVLENSIQAAIVEKSQLSNISQNLSQLVLSYMIHHGYSESAKQLSSDLALQSSQLQDTTGLPIDPAPIDSISCLPMIADTEKRKDIRSTIMAGEIDKAMSMLEDNYPGITDKYGDMLLQLRCRKFVEMVNLASAPLRRLDIEEHKKNQDAQVPLDVEMKESSSGDLESDHDSSKTVSPSMDVDQDDIDDMGALTDAIKYGQYLQEQYKDSRRRSVQDMLIDAFSVLAYTDIEQYPGSKSTQKAKPISREKVANTVNTAILASQNLPTVAPLETLYRQTSVVVSELTRQGVGAAAFYDVHKDCMDCSMGNSTSMHPPGLSSAEDSEAKGKQKNPFKNRVKITQTTTTYDIGSSSTSDTDSFRDTKYLSISFDNATNTSAALAAATEKIAISTPRKSQLKRRLIVSESEEEESEAAVVDDSSGGNVDDNNNDDDDDDDEELKLVLAQSKLEYDARTALLDDHPRKSSSTPLSRSSPYKERSFSMKISMENSSGSRRPSSRINIDSEDSDSNSRLKKSNNGNSDSRTRQQTRTKHSSRTTGSPSGSTEKSETNANKKQKTSSNRYSNGTKRFSGYYTVDRNYLDEAGNILIVGEEDNSAGDDGEEETLPVRVLYDFTVYNGLESKGDGIFRIAGLESYHMEGYDLRASGKVRPEPADNADQGINDDDDSEDGQEEEQFINTSSIFYVQITSDRSTNEDVVWLRTQFAFYRLEQPSAIYSNCFGRTMKQKLIACDDNSADDGSEYENIDNIDSMDVEDEYNLESDRDQGTIRRSNASKGPSKTKKTGKSKSGSTIPSSKKSGLNTVEPCVTPLIASLAGDLFNRQLNIADHEVDEAARSLLADEQHLLEIVKDYTLKTKWSGRPIGKTGDRTYYGAACVDGVELEIGDYVYVRNDSMVPWLAKIMYFFQDGKEMYYHIRYFSRGSETILMETAGSREIFLLDNCGDAELVTVMDKCPVKYIGSSEEIPPKDYYYRFWYDSELWRFEDAEDHEALTEKNLDLCKEYEPCASCSRLLQEELVNTQPMITHKGSFRTPTFKHLKQEYHERDFVYLVHCQIAKGIMEPTNTSSIVPYDIGQIINVQYNSKNDKSDLIVEVQLFERHDDFLDRNPAIKGIENRIQKPVFKDNKRLVLTNNIQKYSVDALEGTCRVKFMAESCDSDMEALKELEEYKNQADSYYYKDYFIPEDKSVNILSLKTLSLEKEQKSPAEKRKNLARISDCGTVTVGNDTIVVQRPRPCGICEKEREIHLDQQMKFQRSITKLRALDIFSGCGGLSLGLKDSGAVDSKYSIEFMTSAAETYRHNFPGATVYNDDANTLLGRTIDQCNGKIVPPKNDFGGKPLPDMPRPGDVDLIYCGPPCQGFSGLNQYQKADDIKNSLIATSMSYVDFYKPQYFLLENVRGMLQFRLGKSKVNNKWEGGIHMGVIKFVIRCLTAMGYQCRFGLLQAGHHNVPQSRRRLFIWGAKLGSNLPEFPLPATCFAINGVKINPPPGLKDHGAFHYLRHHISQAPDPGVTVRDAIGDLPGFEYINPHILYEESEKEKRNRILEERWTFREMRRIRRRKAKQIKKMRENYDLECDDSDVDGYLSHTDESETEKERVEEGRAAAKEAEGRPSIVPSKPYFPLVDGRASVNGFTVYGDQANGDDDDGGLCGTYWSRPQSEYQRRMRARAGKIVKNHIARGFNELNLERICRVAMRPDADHKTLPEKLKPWCLSSPDSAASRHRGWEGLYGRLDYEGRFLTAVTEMQPMGKQGKVIHPNQRRVLSVRESARVQGFPDDFEFLSTNGDTKSMYMQVGNAVPPPLARALGLKLRDAMMLNSLSKGKSRKQ